MQIAQVVLMGVSALFLLLLLLVQERTRRAAAKQNVEFAAQINDLMKGIAHSSETVAAEQMKVSSSIAESTAGQSKRLETSLFDLEQRCKELAATARQSAEIHDDEIRNISRELRKESESRSITLADSVKAIIEQLKQTSAAFQERIVEDSLARDGKTDDLLEIMQKDSEQRSQTLASIAKSIGEELGRGISSLERLFSSEEAKRFERSDRLLADLKNEMERLATTTATLLRSLEESVKF